MKSKFTLAIVLVDGTEVYGHGTGRTAELVKDAAVAALAQRGLKVKCISAVKQHDYWKDYLSRTRTK